MLRSILLFQTLLVWSPPEIEFIPLRFQARHTRMIWCVKLRLENNQEQQRWCRSSASSEWWQSDVWFTFGSNIWYFSTSKVGFLRFQTVRGANLLIRIHFGCILSVLGPKMLQQLFWNFGERTRIQTSGDSSFWKGVTCFPTLHTIVGRSGRTLGEADWIEFTHRKKWVKMSG